MPDTLTEPLLIQGQDEQQYYHFSTPDIEIVAFTAVSPEKDTPNEDCLALIPLESSNTILAVADGAGGTRQGDVASRIAVDTLKAVLTGKDKSTDTRSSILTAFEQANRNIIDLGVGANTTLVVIEYDATRIRPYHAGDSMIMSVGQRGRIKYQTVPHSPTGYAVEAGLLEENAALHHEDRHLVTNMLGNESMHVEIGPYVGLSAYDTVVIGSDGLYDNLYKEEIIERIRAGKLQRVAKRLADDTLERMTTQSRTNPSKADDLSFIVMRRRRGAGQGRGHELRAAIS